MTLQELKNAYSLYHNGIAEWSEKRGAELTNIIHEAQTRNGAAAMDILEYVPSTAFTDEQLDELFQSILFWIQGPSKLYISAIRVAIRHASVLLTRLERGFIQANKANDDSLIRGYCHIFSLLDIELQHRLAMCVKEALPLANSDARNAIEDLIDRCRAFN